MPAHRKRAKAAPVVPDPMPPRRWLTLRQRMAEYRAEWQAAAQKAQAHRIRPEIRAKVREILGSHESTETGRSTPG